MNSKTTTVDEEEEEVNETEHAQLFSEEYEVLTIS